MLNRYPNYYPHFACLAGSCPDTCCADWEIVVDDETAARWAALDSPLGHTVQNCLTVDTEGDRILRTQPNGLCPMLMEDGLCLLQRELGHEALCRTCREYPRLRQDYGTFVEHGLSLSCPAAAALILQSNEDHWIEDGEPEPTQPEYDPTLMALLQQTRGPLLALLRNPSYSVGDSLSLALLYGYAVQDALNGMPLQFDPLQELAALPAPQFRDFAPMLDFHRSLEILTETWATALRQAGSPGPWPDEIRALAAYYVNRYWLQAVSDRDVIWRIKQMLVACLMARILPEHIVLYSREVEHDSDNVDRIWEAADSSPAWTDLALLDWLRF